MEHDAALAMVNTLHTHLALLARNIVVALHDQKVSPQEGLMLGMQGLQFAMALIPLLQGATPEMRQGLLFVLEHGTTVLPEI